MEDQHGSRPRRRCNSRKHTAMPSATHYVGYVEDEETPEAIMRKFEELEKVLNAEKQPQEQPSTSGQEDAVEQPTTEVVAEGLTEEQLMQVFKQTSMFSVKTLQDNNEALMVGGESGTLDDAYSDDGFNSDAEDCSGFFSDEDPEEYAAHWKNLRKGKKGGTGATRGQRGANHSKPKSHTVTHFNVATRALIRRKIRVVDKNATAFIKIPPPPLPLSWGRMVQPWQPADAAAAEPNDENTSFNIDAPTSTTLEQSSIVSAQWSKLRKDYQAVLINSAWEADAKREDLTWLQRLQKLPLDKLCPVGFVFLWVDKEHIHSAVQHMYKLGFAYVENLTWVFLGANNGILRLPGSVTCRSHYTLYIFRKQGLGRDIELKHQRNPDVVFDTIRATEGLPLSIPEEAYVAIETLLPTGKGKFLELWGAKGVQRPGWTHIVEAS